MTTIPRGIRNNNPGNLDWRASNPWLGQIGMEDDPDGDGPRKGRFAKFKSPAYGLRAMMKLLLTYQNRYGVNTIGKVVARYAPSEENDTFNYARMVAKAMSVGVNAELDFRNEEVLIGLTRAMVRHENGAPPAGKADWYDGAIYKEAARMALGRE